MIVKLPKKLTLEWIESIDLQSINLLINEILAGSEWLRSSLEVPADSFLNAEFISLYEETSPRFQIAFAEQLLERYHHDLPFGFAHQEFASLFKTISFLVECVEITHNPSLYERTNTLLKDVLNNFDHIDICILCARGLVELEDLGAKQAIQTKIDTSEITSGLTPYLIKATVQTDSLLAIQCLFSGDDDLGNPALIYAIDNALRSALKKNTTAALDLIRVQSLSWSPEQRKMIGQLLKDDDFTNIAVDFDNFVKNLKSGYAASFNETTSAWNTYVETAKENGEIATSYLGFASESDDNLPYPIMLYRNALARQVSNASGAATIRAHHNYPANLKIAIDDHFDGKRPILDIQWATKQRRQRGRFLKFGGINTFCVVVKNGFSNQLSIVNGASPINPNDTISTLVSDPTCFSNNSICLDQLIELDKERTIYLSAQSFSAFNDLLYERMKDENLEDTSGRYGVKNILDDGMGEIGVKPLPFLRDILTENVPHAAILEWNFIADNFDITSILAKTHFDMDLKKVILKNPEKYNFSFFKGHLDEPLEAGFFTPLNDSQYFDAVFNSAKIAFTQEIANGQLDWTPEMKDLASSVFVILDDADQVFSDEIINSSVNSELEMQDTSKDDNIIKHNFGT